MLKKTRVHELRARASEIIREVRQHRAHYSVTYEGRTVAVLLPVGEFSPDHLSSKGAPGQNAWDELEKLGEEIGRGWQLTQNSSALLSELRR